MIYSRIIQLLASKIGSEVEYAAKEAVSPLAPYLRRLAFGMLVVSSAVVGFGIAILFAIASLFLELANFNELSIAALWTSLVSFAVTLFLTYFGFSFIKKPRR